MMGQPGWMARTMADEFREERGSSQPAAAALSDRHNELQPVERVAGRAKVKCPGCEIEKNPFQLVDARNLPWWPHDYICDGCRYKVVREGRTTHADMARELGAPEDHAKMIEQKEKARNGNRTE